MIDLIAHAQETTIQTFSEEYLNRCNQFIVSVGFDDFDLISLFVLFRSLYTEENRISNFSHFEEFNLLCDLFEDYKLKLIELNNQINALSSGHGGQVVNDKVVYQNTPQLGGSNTDISRIEEVLLICEALNMQVPEFQITTGLSMVPLPNMVKPIFDEKEMQTKGKYYLDLCFKLQDYYSELMKKAGYSIDAKDFYYPYYKCEKYDFPEEFEKIGFVISRDKLIETIRKWDAEFRSKQKPHLSLTFHKDASVTLVINDAELKKLQTHGLNLDLPKMRFPVTLPAAFFNNPANYEQSEDSEAGEIRYRCTITKQH